jgi:hypothetical protein
MKVPYLAVKTRKPVPSLGGASLRYRPVTAVIVTGSRDTKIRDGLLDSGADDTVFTEDLAILLGIDLAQAEERSISLAGRHNTVRVRYAPVKLRISDATEAYEWTAVVGFVSGKLHYNLLGQAGFLQYFNTDFRGEERLAILNPNASFPGTVGQPA